MTDVALKEYFETRLHDLDRRMEARFTATELALDKAETSMGVRLDSMNEFRDALRDQASRMATRMELDKVDEAVRELQRAKAYLDGRLVVLCGSISIAISALLWGLGRFFR